eukprot:COSAG02_NODE_2877_length_7842_cov_3.566060_2_plen_172_part_00
MPGSAIPADTIGESTAQQLTNRNTSRARATLAPKNIRAFARARRDAAAARRRAGVDDGRMAFGVLPPLLLLLATIVGSQRHTATLAAANDTGGPRCQRCASLCPNEFHITVFLPEFCPIQSHIHVDTRFHFLPPPYICTGTPIVVDLVLLRSHRTWGVPERLDHTIARRMA